MTYEVEKSEEIYAGRIFRLVRDAVRMPDGRTAIREVVVHPGAAVVVALDDAENVVLLRQYRHPVRAYLWELPAGLLDVAGEPAHVGAARELAEETALTASTWHTLLDLRSSPGFSDEAVRVFLARGLAEVPVGERYVGQHEEADMTVERVPLDDAVARVLAGQIENAAAAAGILAAWTARARGWADQRPADAPWRAKPALAAPA